MSLGILDLTESQLLAMTEEELLAMTETGDTPTPTPTTGCCWTAATVASLQTSISNLASQLTALQTAVSAIPTTTYTVPTTEQITNAVWSASSKEITGTVTVNSTQAASFATATGFATPSDVTTAKDAIITQGNSAWTTATGFVTSVPSTYDIWHYGLDDRSDIGQISVGADSIIQKINNGILSNVPSQQSIDIVPQKVWSYYSQEETTNSRTLTSGTSGGATAAEVWAYNGGRTLTGEVTVNSEQATAFSQVADVSGLATSSALSAVKTAVDAIPTTTYTVPTTEEIKNAVWNATTKEITGDVNVSASSIASIQNGLSTFDPSEDAVTVNSEQATAFSQVADVSGLATAANLTTALTLLNKLFGLIGYFSVSSNTLTTYNSAGTALATYTLTRDASQNITGVTPND